MFMCVCVYLCECICVCICVFMYVCVSLFAHVCVYNCGFFMVKILGILYNLVFCVETKNKGRMVI